MVRVWLLKKQNKHVNKLELPAIQKCQSRKASDIFKNFFGVDYFCFFTVDSALNRGVASTCGFIIIIFFMTTLNLYPVQPPVCLSLRTHRTSHQQEPFVDWLPARSQSSPRLVGTHVLDRPMSSVLPNTSASWQHGGEWRETDTKAVLSMYRARFLSRPEYKHVHLIPSQLRDLCLYHLKKRLNL